MSKILVSGLVNKETTLKIESFPIEYCPVNYCFDGIESSISGVGINIAKALNKLGTELIFTSIVGDDIEGENAKTVIKNLGIDTEYMVKAIDKTAQSVILYDNEGIRQINVDLKNIQETKYPLDKMETALKDCKTAMLCNINFNRDFLEKAKTQNIKIATDVHCIESINDSYNKDFMRAADILFLSNEKIKNKEEAFLKQLIEEYNNEIIVIGLGSQGALMYVRKDGFIGKFDAVYTRPIVNTIGAGDSLFSSFNYYYNKTDDPYISIKKAIIFASWKIGVKSASDGFLTEHELDTMYLELYNK